MPFEFKPIERWFASDSGLILPVPISQGGTGATSAAGALANLGGASVSASQSWSGVNFFVGSNLRTSDLVWTDAGNTALKYEWYYSGDGTFRLYDDVNGRDLLIVTPGANSSVSGLTVNGFLSVAGSTVGLAKGTITGDGVTTSFTITHNLNKPSPYQMIAQFYNRTGTDQESHPSISGRGANSFTATWSVAPANGTLIDWQVM